MTTAHSDAEGRPASNRLYYGDCLEVMDGFPSESADLIYLDPPFNSDADYNILYGAVGTSGGPTAQVRAFQDTWQWDEEAAARARDIRRATAHPARKAIAGLSEMLGDSGMLAYLSYMALRLAAMKRILKPTGSIYLHCDPTASHYLKALMDAIFGAANFVNEITWKRYAVHSLAESGFNNVADVILFYAADRPRMRFNKVHAAAGDDELTQRFPHVEVETGRRFQHVALEQSANRASAGETRVIEGREVSSALGWRWTQETFDRRVAANPRVIYWTANGRPRYKLYADEYEGAPVGNIWTDIPYLSAGDAERTGYPTQKPLALMERIIKASSDEGGVVLDPFCGCGTTIRAAHNLNRRWIGVDVSPFAIDFIKTRRFPDMRIETHGVPADMDGAAKLAAEKPFDFEAWAVTRIPGLLPNERKTGDRGVDGRGALLEAAPPLPSDLTLAQVKGGRIRPGHVRDFLHTVRRENAAFGVFITLEPVQSSDARAEAAGEEPVTLGASRYPRVQLWSIRDYFEGRMPILPSLADPYTGKPMQATLAMT